MPKIPSIFFVFRKELLSPKSIFFILFIAFLYIIFTLSSLNHSLVSDTIFSSTLVAYKISLLSSLLMGLFTAFSPVDTAITIASSILVGLNLVLIAKTIYKLEHLGKVRVSVGGATIIGLVTTGCSSCGFSLLSILGIGTSFSFLPFHGMEIHIASVLLLGFSAWYMVKKLRDSVYCRVK
ncbi:MAG TPA: hypothetical protein VF189_05995 [Patescibacteria group bacterium]